MARPQQAKFIQEMKSVDELGNEWKLSIRPNEDYKTRYILEFTLNNKVFPLQNFSTTQYAKNTWELIQAITKQGDNNE